MESEREVVWRRAFVFGLYRGCLIFKKKHIYPYILLLLYPSITIYISYRFGVHARPWPPGDGRAVTWQIYHLSIGNFCISLLANLPFIYWQFFNAID